MSDFYPVIFGAGAALAWGLYDYLSAKLARSHGYQRAYFENSVSSAFIALLLIIAAGKLELPVAFETQAIIFAVSFLTFVGSLWTFKSFELGKVSINSPITSLYAVVTVIAVALLTNANLPLQKLSLGIAAVLCSALAAFHTLNLREYKMEKGIKFAAMATVVFTMTTTLPAVIRSQFNEYTFALLAVAVPAVCISALNFRKVAQWTKTISLAGIVVGLLNLLGWIFYLYGINSAGTVVAVALTALYPTVPLVASALRREEELNVRQKTALAAMLVLTLAFLMY